MRENIFYSYQNVLVKQIVDPNINLEGYLVINKQFNGLSCGGLRMMPTITLQEIKDLARIMSLKQGFIGLPRGGARAGIMVEDSISDIEKQQLINRFGELIREELIDRRYLLGPDVGTNPTLINEMYRHLHIDVPKPSKTSANSGYYTSISVQYCIEFGLQLLGKKLKGSTVAIEGFGRVGKPLALKLHELGAKVVAVSNFFGGVYRSEGLNILDLAAFVEKNGETKLSSFPNAMAISKEALLELEVDTLSPCATDSTIYSGNAENIQAPLVCAGANNPVTAKADEILFKKNILYFPDFITNCGGVLGNAVEFAGLKEKNTHQLIQEEVIPILLKMYNLSKQRQISIHNMAIEMVDDKMKQAQNTSSSKSMLNSLTQLGLKFYRKGWIPSFLVKEYAYRAIQQRLRNNLL